MNETSAKFREEKVPRASFSFTVSAGAARVSRAMFARLEPDEALGGAAGAPADEEAARFSPDEYDEGGPLVPRGRDLANAGASGEDDARAMSSSAPGLTRRVPRAVLAAVRPGPFAALAAATVIQVCAGLTYSFGAYSENLRTAFGGSERTVALLGTVKDAGAYFGLPGGAVFDAFGPAVTLLVGAVAHTLGFLGVYGVLVGKSPFVSSGAPSLPYAAFVIFASSNGNSLFDTAALLACMRYFPEDKAAVAGVLKAYLGLSSAVFQQAYATFVPVSRDGGDEKANGDRAPRFVLLVAVIGGAAAVLGAPFFLVRENVDGKTTIAGRGRGNGETSSRLVSRRRRTKTALSHLNRLVVALALAVSVAAAANDPSVVGVAAPPRWVNGAFTLALLALLLAPFVSFAAVGAFGNAKDARVSSARGGAATAGDGLDGDDASTDPLLPFPILGEDDGDRARSLSVGGGGGGVRSDGSNDDDERREAPTDRDCPFLVGGRRVDLGLLESFRSPEQWLLFATISASSGAAMALVNNLDQVSAAVGSAEAASSALVSVFSVCNCLGRLIGGEASEFLFRRFAVSRVSCLASAQVAVAFGVGVAASFPTPFGVFVAVAVVGGALGAHWGALPTLTTELFGSKHVGAIYGWLCVSPMLGSYALSTRVFGDWYDDALARQAPSSGRSTDGGVSVADRMCLGEECFRGAFLVGAACATASAAVTCALAVRCARVYARLREKLDD